MQPKIEAIILKTETNYKYHLLIRSKKIPQNRLKKELLILHLNTYISIHKKDYKSQEQLEQIYADAILGKSFIDLSKIRKPAIMNKVKSMFHEKERFLRMVVGPGVVDIIKPVLDEMDIITSEDYYNEDQDL